MTGENNNSRVQRGVPTTTQAPTSTSTTTSTTSTSAITTTTSSGTTITTITSTTTHSDGTTTIASTSSSSAAPTTVTSTSTTTSSTGEITSTTSTSTSTTTSKEGTTTKITESTTTTPEAITTTSEKVTTTSTGETSTSSQITTTTPATVTPGTPTTTTTTTTFSDSESTTKEVTTTTTKTNGTTVTTAVLTTTTEEGTSTTKEITTKTPDGTTTTKRINPDNSTTVSTTTPGIFSTTTTTTSPSVSSTSTGLPFNVTTENPFTTTRTSSIGTTAAPATGGASANIGMIAGFVATAAVAGIASYVYRAEIKNAVLSLFGGRVNNNQRRINPTVMEMQAMDALTHAQALEMGIVKINAQDLIDAGVDPRRARNEFYQLMASKLVTMGISLNSDEFKPALYVAILVINDVTGITKDDSDSRSSRNNHFYPDRDSKILAITNKCNEILKDKDSFERAIAVYNETVVDTGRTRSQLKVIFPGTLVRPIYFNQEEFGRAAPGIVRARAAADHQIYAQLDFATLQGNSDVRTGARAMPEEENVIYSGLDFNAMSPRPAPVTYDNVVRSPAKPTDFSPRHNTLFQRPGAAASQDNEDAFKENPVFFDDEEGLELAQDPSFVEAAEAATFPDEDTFDTEQRFYESISGRKAKSNLFSDSQAAADEDNSLPSPPNYVNMPETQDPEIDINALLAKRRAPVGSTPQVQPVVYSEANDGLPTGNATAPEYSTAGKHKHTAAQGAAPGMYFSSADLRGLQAQGNSSLYSKPLPKADRKAPTVPAPGTNAGDYEDPQIAANLYSRPDTTAMPYTGKAHNRNQVQPIVYSAGNSSQAASPYANPLPRVARQAPTVPARTTNASDYVDPVPVQPAAYSNPTSRAAQYATTSTGPARPPKPPEYETAFGFDPRTDTTIDFSQSPPPRTQLSSPASQRKLSGSSQSSSHDGRGGGGSNV